jgi:CRP-like cAMP-binding protein
MKKTIFKVIKMKDQSKTGKSFLKSMMGNYYHLRLKEKIDHLKKHLFPNLQIDEIKELSRNFEERNFIKNEFLEQEGELVEDLYLLIEGEIAMTKKMTIKKKKTKENDSDIKNSHFFQITSNKNVCILRPGVIIGLNEIFGNKQKYEFSFKILTETNVVYKLKRSSFCEIIKNNKIKKHLLRKNSLFDNLIVFLNKKILLNENFDQNNFNAEIEKENKENVLSKNPDFRIKKFQRFKIKSFDVKDTRSLQKENILKEKSGFYRSFKILKNSQKNAKRKKIINLSYLKKNSQSKQILLKNKDIKDTQKVLEQIDKFKVISFKNNNSYNQNKFEFSPGKIKKTDELKNSLKSFHPFKTVFSTFIKKSNQFILKKNPIFEDFIIKSIQ